MTRSADHRHEPARNVSLELSSVETNGTLRRRWDAKEQIQLLLAGRAGDSRSDNASDHSITGFGLDLAILKERWDWLEVTMVQVRAEAKAYLDIDAQLKRIPQAVRDRLAAAARSADLDRLADLPYRAIWRLRMTVKGIRSDDELNRVFRRMEEIFQAKAGTAEADERDALLTLIEAYENAHYDFGPADPVEAIKFRKE